MPVIIELYGDFINGPATYQQIADELRDVESIGKWTCERCSRDRHAVVLALRSPPCRSAARTAHRRYPRARTPPRRRA